MPGMNGHELSMKVKQDPEQLSISFNMFSSKIYCSEIVECHNCPAKGRFNKPNALKEFMTMFKEMMGLECP